MVAFGQIERRSNLSREEFIENYLKPRRPVVLTDIAHRWDATKKWTFEYFKEEFGDIEVPIVGPNFSKPGPNYMKPEMNMKLKDYLEILQSGEKSPYRIFLWNILENVPQLASDVSNHLICDGWIDNFPFMFFGGKGAVTNLHYDIDCSHVFHTHFLTRKHIILFDQEQSTKLYHQPFTVKSLVDPTNPDFERYPAFKNVVGHETMLQHGETLFIPSLWWHHIVYVDPGFSISLRAVDSLAMQARGLWNITRHFVVDKGLNAVMGDRWNDWKEHTAYKRAEAAI
ncbi:MAG: cupin-like domain-containing protein [Saprospiraceae bacterium]|nr:cupin-like domain-containing protein [Saprospiraceae bacterium]MBP7699791.1 cupin-like domain-containing protein [Saprospiraceae bacterium]